MKLAPLLCLLLLACESKVTVSAQREEPSAEPATTDPTAADKVHVSIASVTLDNIDVSLVALVAKAYFPPKALPAGAHVTLAYNETTGVATVVTKDAAGALVDAAAVPVVYRIVVAPGQSVDNTVIKLVDTRTGEVVYLANDYLFVEQTAAGSEISFLTTLTNAEFSALTKDGLDAAAVATLVSPTLQLPSGNSGFSSAAGAAVVVAQALNAYDYQLFSDGACSAKVAATATRNGQALTLSVGTLAEGTHKFYLGVVDGGSGKVICTDSALTYVIDRTVPVTPASLTVAATPTPGQTTAALSLTGLEVGTKVRLYDDAACTHAVTAPVAVTQASQQVTVSGLAVGSHTFYAQQTDAAGNVSACSAASPAVAITPAPPGTPTGLVVTPNDNSVGLSWQAATGATSYAIERSTSPTSGFTQIASGITGTTYTDSTVSNGTLYYYRITASGPGGTSAVSPAEDVTPNVPVPAISYAGSPFQFTQGTAVGTITPGNTGGAIVSCAVNPTLPAGVTLSSACVIGGTPSATQSAASYTVTPTNATGNGAGVVISIAVRQPVPAVSYSGSPFTFTRGTSVGTITPSNSGGSIVTCSASPTLPAGLAISNACVISGNPTTTQSAASYTVTAVNGTGSSAGAVISITVQQPVPTISYSGSPFTFTQNTSVGTVTPGSTGGTIASCADSPTLPAGLSLSSACVITGTPTSAQSAATYTITPTNATGSGSGVSISITVQPALPALSYSGSPYTFTQNSSVGTITPGNTGGTVTGCDITPTIPAGLTLSTACVITGTPTGTQSTTSYTITPSNATGDGADVTISITIDAPAASSGLLKKVNSTPLTVSASTSNTHLSMGSGDGLPSTPLLALWQTDVSRTGNGNSRARFLRNSTLVETQNDPYIGTAVVPYMGFKYYSSYANTDPLNVQGVAGAGATVVMQKSSIFAFDLTGVQVFESTSCTGSTVDGTNNNACTITVPGNKNGQSWLFLTRINAIADVGEAHTFTTTLAFNAQTVAQAGSHNIESGWQLNTVIPHAYTFTDNASRDFTFSYYAQAWSGSLASSGYSVTIVGIDLTNLGSIVDVHRAGYLGWNDSPYQSYMSRTLNLPSAGEYLVLTYAGLESPNSISTIRVSVDSTVLQEQSGAGGGSGQQAYLSTMSTYQAASAGNHTFKMEFQGDYTGNGASMSEGTMVVLKLN